MHQAQAYVDQVIRAAAGGDLRNVALTTPHSQGLTQRLALDAVGYYYSGALSIGEAVQGTVRGQYTWATVKLYYASFYLFRSLLAVNGICLFYDGRKPFLWTSTPGETPRKGKDNTHKVVLTEFKRSRVATKLLSQDIGLENPLVWLISKREDANYNRVRFLDPEIPPHFAEIDRITARTAFTAYAQDTSFMYAFDEDHAILAYPVEVLKEAKRQLELHPLRYCLSAEDRRYAASLYSDALGPLPEARNLLAPT